MLEVEKLAELKQNIKNAEELSHLRSLRDQFQLSIHVNEQLHHKDSIADMNMFINEFHDALIAKVITLAEIWMVGEGHGPPPTSYSYILLGSAGRSEQTLASDQDSALIYEDGNQTDEVKQYYLIFTQKIVSMLILLGYPPCDGKVQSNEPMWCQSVKEWKGKLEHWFLDASWESVRYLLIVADARSVAGEITLFREVRAYYRKLIRLHPQMLERMIHNTIQYKMVVGVFGQFITERYGEEMGSIDVKYGSYIPIVNGVRWLALQSEITATSTLERLKKLLEFEVISQHQFEQYTEAFLQMLKLRLLAGYHIEDGIYEGKSKFNPKRLEVNEIKRLKKHFKVGRELQKLVLKEFARHK